MLELEPEDEAFLNRLFGTRVAQDDLSFRPNLEWIAHVDVVKADASEPVTSERYTRPMLTNLVGWCLHNGVGNRSIVGWSLEETDELFVLGVLVVKQKAAEAA